MTRPETDRLNAALSSRYRIERRIGEGGMATVYLADDLKHHRKVALKVLKPELAAVVGADRFLAEIETTANLTHPHILPLYDSGEAVGENDGGSGRFVYYVMPYVRGESLRDRLDRERQLPVDEALAIAEDLAGALDYAHRQGVIHRDIKPANVLLHDGQPLIADFGIALAVGAAGPGRLTETGMSLGTPHYMSPEQATGDQAVGPATDVYSLGCVLYETLTGEPPYVGSTTQAVLGRIVTGTPEPVTERRPSVPAHVDAAVRKALEKVPADRFGTAGEMARALADPGFRWGKAGEGARFGPAAPAVRIGGASFWAGGAAGAALVAILLSLFAVGGALPFRSAPEGEPAEVRYTSLLLPPESAPPAATSVPLAISRDGSRIAYRLEEADGTRSIWTRRFADREAVRLTELGAAGSVFLSPDGRWVGFHDAEDGVIRRMPAVGGAAEALGSTGLDAGGSGFYGADWGPDGTIVFATREGLGRLAADGGEPEALTSIDPDGRLRHVAPSVLPDGSGVVFAEVDRVPVPSTSRIRVRFFDGREADLVPGHSPRVTPDGILVYGAVGGTLSALRLDDAFTRTAGAPVRVADGVSTTSVDRAPAARFGVADDGTLVTFPYFAGSRIRELIWADREGNREPLLDVSNPQLPPNSTGIGPGRISPDGRRVAFRANYAADPRFRLFVFDVERGVVSPVTVDWSADWPVWTPDGQRLAFNRFSGSEQNLYWARADNADQPAPLFGQNPLQQHAQEFTADGRFVLVQERSEPNGPDSDILLYPVERGDEPRRLVDGSGLEVHATLSPNERWMAYASDESGQREVYVTDFPDARSRIKVSTEPAQSPVWSPTLDELYYQRMTDGAVMVVPVRFDPTFQPGVPRVLFEWDFRVTWPFGRVMDVHPDGERFLLMRADGGEGGVPRIEVAQNWLDEARRRLDEAEQ